ncbi:hypothetical protein [Vibrio cortegadensis]|uniref:Uncharacterized protein n=1 Tax=Vibrio cortegadensis TaxID=1328770 RepID=A0ABV4M473_9VIBR
MAEQNTQRFGQLFTSSDNESKPKETLSLPVWKDIDLTFKDIFVVSVVVN